MSMEQKPSNNSQRGDVGVDANPLTKDSTAVAEAVTLDLNDEWLPKIIDIKHGLLRKLLSCRVIDQEQFELIRNQPIPTDKIRQLLEEVKKMTPRQQQQFLTALDNDHQSHVSNYIRQNGQRPAAGDEKDNWPIAVCSQWLEIEQNWTELVDTIPSDATYLDTLLKFKCITEGQEQMIFNQQQKFKRNEVLLDNIKLRSVRDYSMFLECLKKFDNFDNRVRLELYRIEHAGKKTTTLPTPPSTTIGLTPLNLTDERLLEIMDIQHGLLRELRSRHVLNQRQVELIENEELPTEMVRQLLNEINGMTDEKQWVFLSALDKLQQSHVANYIRNNGERPTTDVNDWPLAVCSQWTKLKENWARLVETTELDNNFIEQLISSKCVSGRQEQTLRSLKSLTESKRSTVLLNILKHGSVRNYNNFLKCLASMNHNHYKLVSLLASGNSRNVQLSPGPPLQHMLKVNHPVLAQLIDTKTTSLLDDLVSVNIISVEDCVLIRETSGHVDANTKLLNILQSRCSYYDLFMFATFLELTGQVNAVNILTSNGVVAQVVAKTIGSLEDEEILVEAFKTYLRLTCPKRRQELYPVVMNLFAELNANEANEVIAVQETSSIKVFILCKSWLGFSYLYELYSSGNLKTIIQQIITALSENKNPVLVDRLVWNMSDYVRCAYHLSMVEDLRIYQRVYELAQQSPDDSKELAELEIISTSFDRLPHEIVELLLLKAAGQLFVIINKMTARADIHILAMLCAVSRYWWQTLLYQKSNKTLLSQYFENVCHPYRLKSKLVNTLSLPMPHFQIGMAEFDDMLFLSSNNGIQVFNVASNHYAREEDIILPAGFLAKDIVVCITTRCLFVTSTDMYSIWRIKLLDNNKIEKWIVTDYSPDKITLRFDRLLVISNNGKAIFLFNKETQLLHKRVRTPPNMYVYDAVETANETFIVSISSGCLNPHREISELSGEGHLLRSYEGTEPVAYPVYLTATADDNILVVDWRRQQVLILSTELELKQVIPTSVEVVGELPRLCYSHQAGKLYVFRRDSGSSRLNVFMIKK